VSGRERRSRATRRRRASKRRASRTSRARRHRRGRHHAVYPGLISRTSVAVRICRTRSRSRPSSSRALAGAYWRGDSDRPQLTRIYGTASTRRRISTRISSGSRRRREARPPQARHRARPLPPLGALARITVLAPERDGDLERARGPPQAGESPARLTSEVKTPLLYDVDTFINLGALRQLQGQACSSSPRRRARSSSPSSR